MVLHFKRDRYLEQLRGAGLIGTTLKGIGPAYESKFGRYGIRLVDFRDVNRLKDKIYAFVGLLERFTGKSFSLSSFADQFLTSLVPCT